MSTLAVSQANARKTIRELLGTAQTRQMLLADSLKAAKLGTGTFVMPTRKDRTRPNQQTLEMTEDVPAA